MSTSRPPSPSKLVSNPFALEEEEPSLPPSPPRAASPPPDVDVAAGGLETASSLVEEIRDLNKEYAPDGVVTYRHLLSAQSLGPGNPLRIIAHIDVDAAYAQFEAKRLSIPSSVPLCVQQWDGLIAINYAARAFGITRHERVNEAKKKCPHLVMAHVATLKDGDDAPRYHDAPSMINHKVSLEPYRRESQKMIKIFNEECPDGLVEKASIDEAFIDLTVPVRKVLLERYPHLSTLPSDASQGLDTPLPIAPLLDWKSVDWGLVPLSEEVAPPQPSTLQSSADGKGKGKSSQEREETGWANVALWVGGEIMESIRKAVEDQLGYTTSAGIAHNKVLSKLCSAFKKPRAQTVLRTSAVAGFLRPMKFQKIRFLGGKLGDTIAAEYGAETVGDLLFVPLREMQAKFGEDSVWVFNILRGVDFSEVTAKSLVKSMLASKNMRPVLSSVKDGQTWLQMLCIELIGRLKEAREASGLDEDGEGGVWPKTFLLTYREVGQASRTKRVPFPFHRPFTPDGRILKLATQLLSQVLPQEVKPGARKIKLNNIGLGFTMLERLEEGQRGIEGFFKPGPPLVASSSKRQLNVINSDDSDIEIVEDEYAGHPSAHASTSGFPRKRTRADPQPESPSPPLKPATTWTCLECCKKIPLLVLDDDEGDDRSWVTEENDRIKMEHRDWHVAVSLQEGTPPKEVAKSDPAASRKVKVKKDEKGKGKGKDEGKGGLGSWLLKK